MRSSRFPEILDRMPVPVILVELERGTVSFRNAAARELLGEGPADEGSQPESLVEWLAAAAFTDAAGALVPAERNPVLRVARGLYVYGEEVWRRSPDGMSCYLVTGSPLPRIGTLPHLAMVSLADVTPLKAGLRVAALQDRAVRGLGHSLCISDPLLDDNPIVFVNPAFERMTGYPASAMVGRNCRLLQGEGTDPAAVARLRESVAAGEPVTVTLLNYRADGTPFWNELSVSPVHDEDGRLCNFVGIQVDVTSRVDDQLERDARYDRERTARAAAERAQTRLAFLSEASSDFDERLSIAHVLERLARLAVRNLADWSVVDLLGPGGVPRRETWAHRDPEMESVVRLVRPRGPLPHRVGEVFATGQPVLDNEAPLSLVTGGVPDDEQQALARELGHGSVMIVPLAARGRVLGALTLVGETVDRFGEDDLRLAGELARRAATAADNALSFAERDHVARVLQASLLPPTLPRVPGAQVHARYLPAGTGAEVGGDFYDVFETRSGTGLVIGDVCGRGADAAAVTGLARYTVRAVSFQEQRPSEILRLLNRAVLAEEIGDRFVTVAIGLLQPLPGGGGRLRLTLSIGGHPQPYLVRPDGEVRGLGRPGSLIGIIEDVDVEDVDVELAPGDCVVFYTDGVVEAGGEDGLFGETRLCRTLQEVAGRPADQVAAAVVDAVLDHIQGETNDDDIALVVLGVPPVAADQPPAPRVAPPPEAAPAG